MLDEMTLQNASNFAIFLEYGKYLSVLQGHFIKLKPLISEECSGMAFLETFRISMNQYWHLAIILREVLVKQNHQREVLNQFVTPSALHHNIL